MKISWYWILAGFGFLFSLRAVRARADEKRTGLSLSGLWRETLDLFASLLLLITLYDAGLEWEGTALQFRETGFMFLWVAAYLTGRYQRKPELFSASLAALAYAIVLAHRDWATQVSLSLVLAAGLFIFQAAFKGLKYAVRFARVPEAMKGWPVFCLIAFCVTVALSGFAALVF